MFTVCAKCNLRLTVTASDLRAAQGYVRCGRCHNVFNALAALADETIRQPGLLSAADTQTRAALTAAITEPQPPASAPVGPPAPAAPPAPTAVTESQQAQAAQEALAAYDEPENPAAFVASDAALEFNPASTNINEVFIEPSLDERTGTFESITLSADDLPDPDVPEDPSIAPQALSAPMPVPPDHSASLDVHKLRDALAEPQGARPTVIESLETEVVAAADPAIDDEISFMVSWPAAAPSAVEPPGVDSATADEIAGALEPQPQTVIDPEPIEAPPPAPTLLDLERPVRHMPLWAQRSAAALLALVLLVQIVHHYRAQLADIAVLNAPVTSLYQGLGQPLEARWDISSYDVRQLGAGTAGAASGELVVRASIGNHAKRAQPLPLLRVVMQDRFGNRVGGRDLRPAEYLGRGAPRVSLIGPEQRVDVQVAFQDPGQSATGFEIDACMAAHDRTIACANDPGSR